MLLPFKDKEPHIGKNVYLAEGSQVIGDVTLGDDVSVWFNTILRGDLAPIVIGARCNIQDLSMIHVNQNQPVTLEENVSIGHSVTLHGCTIRRGTLVGMGAIILNDAEIGEESIVAAGALVTEHKTFPSRVLIMGSPAKVVRELSESDLQMIRSTANRYAQKAREYLELSQAWRQRGLI